MSSSLIRRVSSLFAGRIRANARLLSSTADVAASASPSSPALETGSDDVVHLTDSCVRRLKELHAHDPSGEKMNLRLAIESGGCSGFQYIFSLDNTTTSDDRVFEKDGVSVVVDNISFDFVKGATVDYVEEMIRSAFTIVSNPSALQGCSCKASFMPKL